MIVSCAFSVINKNELENKENTNMTERKKERKD